MQSLPADNSPPPPPVKTKRDPKASHNYKRTGITGAQWTELIDLVRDGNFISTAALQAGISPNTVYSLRQRHTTGELRKGSSAGQITKLKKAEAEAESVMIKKVRDGKTGWQSAAWWCERRFPNKYAQHQRIDIHATVDRLSQASDREMAQLTREAAQTLGLDPNIIELSPNDYEEVGVEEVET